MVVLENFENWVTVHLIETSRLSCPVDRYQWLVLVDNGRH
jgi:hypothetical protein